MKWGARCALCAVVVIAAGWLGTAGALARLTPSRRASSARVGAASLLGGAPAARTLALDLPLRVDARGLAAFAAAVSTPGSPLYRDYAPVATLARRFGAPAASRGRVVAYLRRAGARDVRVDATGLFVEATMRVATADRLFSARLSRFRSLAVAGRPAQRFVAPAGRTRIPAALRGAVTGVVGLDTRSLADDATPAAGATRAAAASGVTPLRADVASPASSAYPSRTGTPTGCAAAVAQPGFTPNQYLTAYGYGALQSAGYEGQGERVALIEIDGFKSSDVHAFASCFGLPVPTIDAYGVGITKALPAGGESTLDLELLDAAAPRLKEVDVYESAPMATQVLRSLTEPLSSRSRVPDVISASLSTCQPDAQAAIGRAGIDAVESTLQLAAATGVSVLAASGDDGSTACVTSQGSPLARLAVNYPAASPWVTGVGGTNVHLTAQNVIASQTTWNDEPTAVGASGGGSSTFPRPAYQKPVQGSSRREVPDVSMLADSEPGYEIYCSASACERGSSSPWVNVGGTSAGTPLLAAGFALIDQELEARGQQNLGFANPLLYRVARSSAAAQTISDVVTGTNDMSAEVFGHDLGCCSARAGYDMASGLGSVNVAGLASAAATLVPRRVRVGLRLPAQRDEVSAARLLATVSCSTECLMGAYARIRLGARGPTVSAYSAPYELTARRQRTIDVPLSSALRGRITSALDAGQTVTATVYGAVIDASGTIVRQTGGRTLRLS